MEDCLICQRLKNIQHDPLLIHEFTYSYLVLGDHQYFNGYCVLLFKNHVRDMHQLSSSLQTELFQEVMKASNAIQVAFKPWKINYSCYGNQVEHIHWHIFPRYITDPDLRNHPWLNSAKFSAFKPTQNAIDKNLSLIKKELSILT